MKILIADDDPGSRKLLRLLVESHGHVVIEASDGRDGFEKALKHDPDAIISDALMPKMDGFQFLMAVRKDETLSTIPFVFFTAIYTDDKEYELALSLGADALIVKPKKPDDFWREFTAALEKHASGKGPDVRACLDEKGEERFRDYCRLVAAKLEEKVRELEMVIAEHERTKISLLESEERYRLLFESNPHPMWVYDLETLAFLAVNEAAVYLYGYSREEFFSMTIKDIRPPEDVPALIDKVSKVREGFDDAGIWRHRKKDGLIIEVEVSSHSLNFNGRRAKLILAIDVTERRRLEQDLGRAADEWLSTFDAMSNAILLMDLEGKILRCNRAMADLVGKDFSEIIGHQCWEIVHGTSIPSEVCPHELMKRTLKKETIVLPFGPRWFEVSVDPYFDGKGNLIGAVHIMTDVTEHKYFEEELKDSEKKYRDLFENANDAIFILDADLCFLDVNSKAEELTGYSKGELLQLSVFDLVPSEQIQRTGSEFSKLKTIGSYEKFEGQLRRKDGSYIDIEVSSSAIIKDGRMTGARDIVRDITKRKKMDEAIERQKQFTENLIQNSAVATFVLSAQHTVLYWNRACEELTGLPAFEMLGTTAQWRPFCDHERPVLADVVLSEDPEKLLSSHPKYSKSLLKSNGLHAEEWCKDLNGRDRYIMFDAAPIYSPEGKVIAAIETLQDITERKLAEEQLFLAKQEWEETFNTITDMVTVHDKDFNIIHANSAAQKILGLPFLEINKVKCFDYFHGTGCPPEGCPSCRSLVTGKPSTSEMYEPHLKMFIEISAIPRFDSNNQIAGLIHIVRNITERKKAEDVLKEERNKAQQYLDVAGVMIVALDSEGQITLINKKGLEILGYEEHEVISRNWFDLCIPDKVLGEVKGIFRKLMAGDIKLVEYYENPIIIKGGVERFLAFHNAILRIESGDISGVLFSGEDITERKRAKEALERYSQELTSLNMASDTLMLITNLGDIYQEICNIIYSVFDLKMVWLGIIENGSFEVKPVAYAGHENGYLSSVRVTWDDSATGMGPTGMAIKTHATFKININDPLFMPWRLEARKRGFVESVSVPLIYARDKCIGALNFFSDEPDYFTPDRMKLCQIFANQAAIAIENAQLVSGLEAEVSKRTRALEDTNSELQQLNKELYLRREEADAASRSKTDFLANMSHELRTPLNAILGFSEIMQTGMAGPVTDKQKEFLNDIYTSGDHLLTLITDILDLSKIEAGKTALEPETFTVKELIETSLIMFKEKALKHHIKVTAEIDDISITADKRKLKQVMVNLLGNAFKFTPDGGSVQVTARRVKGQVTRVKENQKEETACPCPDDFSLATCCLTLDPDGDFVEISVSDTGIGISKENQQRLFQPFQQVETSLTRKYAGTGLGLSLCRRFVELHGGRIWVESEPGKGSRFVFIILMKQQTGDS